jgi:hypothetical protein
MHRIDTNDVPLTYGRRRIDSIMQPSASGHHTLSLHAIRPRPIAFARQHSELVRRAAVVHRIAAEFREMPGLVLSVEQASRLLGVEPASCERILASLARQGLLRRRSSGSYGSV